MEIRVSRIHLTASIESDSKDKSGQGNTDVIIYLESGQKFIASFFTYANIFDMQKLHRIDGSFLNGSYFWDRNMVLVKDCTMQVIAPVVNDMIDEGNFWEAFREL